MKAKYKTYLLSSNRYTEAFEMLVRNDQPFGHNVDEYSIRLNLNNASDYVIKIMTDLELKSKGLRNWPESKDLS